MSILRKEEAVELIRSCLQKGYIRTVEQPMRIKIRKLTPEQSVQLLQMFQSGVNVSQLALQYHVSRRTIYCAATRFGYQKK